MKSIVIGMEKGLMYEKILTDLGATVVTVDPDPSKNAMYTDIIRATKDHYDFNTAHVCTPNYTHRDIALTCKFNRFNDHAIIFVDSPGYKTANEWRSSAGGATRFMMVKNDQYRNNIKEIIDPAKEHDFIRINWINFNRIPNPGSWQTTRKLAWGGVSRDLIPQLLSYVPLMRPDSYRNLQITGKSIWQNEDLEEITSTKYGKVYPDGVYDVDDYVQLCLEDDDTSLTLTAAWRYYERDDISIKYGGESFEEYDVKFDLGFCPDSAYARMIETAIENQNNNEFWRLQLEQDLWIHNVVSSLDLGYNND